MNAAVIVVIVIVVILIVIAAIKSVLVVPQAQAAVIERLGRYRMTATPGLNVLVPFLDKVRARIDIREQVTSFPPQSVITQDNLTVSIDTVVYYQVTNAHDAIYEISSYISGVEQLTTTTLRNLIGGMSLEETLISRDQINSQLRGVLDEATGRWGIRVARVELKAIDPPASVQDSMEKQMRADREKRAMILNAEGQRESAIKTAEGQKQSQILAAEGSKQAAILAAEADKQSRMLSGEGERAARYLQAQGQAKAIQKIFSAIKTGKPTPEVLAYQYLQTLPQMAQGDSNTVWMVPSDYGKALEGFAKMLGAPGDDGVFRYEPPAADGGGGEPPEAEEDSVAHWFDTSTDPDVAEAVARAEAVAQKEVEGPLTPVRGLNIPETEPGDVLGQRGAPAQGGVGRPPQGRPVPPLPPQQGTPAPPPGTTSERQPGGYPPPGAQPPPGSYPPPGAQPPPGSYPPPGAQPPPGRGDTGDRAE